MKTNFQKYLFPAILCLLSSITYAAKTVKVHTDPLSNINISVTYIHKHLGTGPTGGFLPVLINIDNSSLNQHTWTLTQRPDNYNNNTAATTHFTVAPRSRTRFNYNLPLSGTNNDRYYPYLNFSGFGIKKTQSIGGYQVEVANGAMISNRIAALAPKSIDLEPFNEIAPNLIPNQWQGLHNLSAVILDIQDWTSLNESQKSAIKDWIIAGGELIINESSPNSQLYLLKDFDSHQSEFIWGLGNVRLLEQSTILNLLKSSAYKDYQRNHNKKNGLSDSTSATIDQSINPPMLNVWLISTIMVIFVAFIGPINLFILAKGTKRRRMLITTPIISIIASIVFGLVILISDGFGGDGRYSSFVWLESASNRAVVFQSQIFKSGILFGQEIQRPSQCAMKNYTVRYNKSRKNNSSPQPTPASEEAGMLTAGWFPSRALRLHAMKNIQSTRASLTFINDTTPAIRSSFSQSLKKIIVLDKKGRYWYAESCKPGETADLKPFSFNTVKDSQKKDYLSFITYHRKKKAAAFFAEADDAGEFYLPTHTGINWKTQTVILAGKLITEEAK